MKLCKILLALLFSIATLFAVGQTRIYINDSSYANIPLRLYAYKNLLTHNLELVAEQKVNEKGQLSFNISLQEGQLLFIPIYSFRLVFYANPNEEIELQLPDNQQLKKAFTKLKTYSNREIPLFIKSQNSLNTTITNYDKKYNAFLKQNFKNIYNRKNAKQFISKTNNFKKGNSSEYFAIYTKYKEAYLHFVAEENSDLLLSYYVNQPLQLHNTAYVSLLRKLAKNIALDFAQNPDYKQTYRYFIEEKTYNNLFKVANDITKTSDKAFNVHFLIYVLQSGLQQKLLPKNIVLDKLKILAKHSPNVINKSLSKSILQQQKLIFAGQKVAAFSATATDGKKYTEAIFQSEKPTIVAFLDSTMGNSESIKTLDDLQKKHNFAFNVVAFSCEEKIAAIPQKWKQFTLPYHSYILSDYHLGRFPYYILVDKNGTIAKQTWQQYLIKLEEGK